ncbi:MAG: hypothetical protein ACRDYU_20495, partial [Actinomycetes bacterium]
MPERSLSERGTSQVETPMHESSDADADAEADADDGRADDGRVDRRSPAAGRSRPAAADVAGLVPRGPVAVVLAAVL